MTAYPKIAFRTLKYPCFEVHGLSDTVGKPGHYWDAQVRVPYKYPCFVGTAHCAVHSLKGFPTVSKPPGMSFFPAMLCVLESTRPAACFFASPGFANEGASCGRRDFT